MSENRQIAAILFADIQGYTALMQKDEQMASNLLRRFHEELESKIKDHEGRIVNFYGDGALCIFQNPVKAVHAAMELQQSFQLVPVIPVRIGLHNGTVVTEGDKVFGDSINIASRIESMGIPGSVLLSKKMRDEIKNQSEFLFVSIGSFEFKNVDEPIELFALSNTGFIIPKRDQLDGKIKTPSNKKESPTIPIKWLTLCIFLAIGLLTWLYGKYYNSQKGNDNNEVKSIAVLPFRNLSADQSQNYFAEGIVEMIQSKLSEVKSLKIISMTSMMSYRDHRKPISEIAKELNVNNILEGSVLRDNNKVRIIVKLINTVSNEQIWTQSFDKDLTDIFAIQSSIAQSVTTALKAKLTNTEIDKLAKVRVGDLAAYDLYLSALNDQIRARFDTLKNHSAMVKYQQSIRLDPNFDPAYVGLANCWYNMRSFGCGNPCRDSALRYADLALNLNPSNPDAFILKGQLAFDHNDVANAKIYLEKALDIAPSNSEAMNELGGYYLYHTDSVEKALTLFADALSLDPQNTGADENLNLYRHVGWIYERADMLDEAEAFQKKALSVATAENKKPILANLGDIAILKGDFKLAVNYYDSSNQRNSNAFNVLDNWAFGNDLAGNYKEAEEAYLKMLDMIKHGFNEDIQTHTFRHRYAHILWIKGQKEEAKIQFDKALKKLKADVVDGTRYSGQEYDIAGIYNFLGEKEKAYAWLEKMPFGEYTYKLAKVDPLFKDLIGTPRYEKIMAPHHEKIHKMQVAIRKLEANGRLMKELKN